MAEGQGASATPARNTARPTPISNTKATRAPWATGA